MNYKITKILLLKLLFYTINTHTFISHHFYRASYLPFEPRIDRDYLATFDVKLSGGSTTKALDKNGKIIPISFVFSNKYVNYEYLFEIFEANINLTQNFTQGLFINFYLPIRIIHFGKKNPPKPLKEKNKKKYNLISSNLQAPYMFFNSLRQADIADCILFFGKTYNNPNTTYLDYIDATLQTGLLCPTSKKYFGSETTKAPYGYNKDWGMPLSLDSSIGYLDWVTLGLHLDAILFFKKKTYKTGTIGCVSTYLKADHLNDLLNLTIGYSYVYKREDKFYGINGEQCYKNLTFFESPWSMHTLNFLAEFDFTYNENYIAPKIGIFFNKVLSGRRILLTNIKGGSIGLEFAWKF